MLTYKLNPDADQKLNKQETVVHNELATVDKPVTASELAAKVEAAGNLETRQPVLRVVGYYLANWKKTGLVLVDKTPVKAVAAKAVAAKAVAAEPTIRHSLTQAEKRPNTYAVAMSHPLAGLVETTKPLGSFQQKGKKSKKVA